MIRVVLAAALVCLLTLGWGVSPVQADEVPTGLDLTNGHRIFEVQCVGCHANGGNIIRRGKTLKLKALQRNHRDSLEAIADIVRNGKMPMSAYKDKLTEPEILDVSAYVLNQAQQEWK
jgi:cytochrome c6